MSDWFHIDDHWQPQGPLSGQALCEQFRAGQVTADTLVWREGLQDWQPLLCLMA